MVQISSLFQPQLNKDHLYWQQNIYTPQLKDCSKGSKLKQQPLIDSFTKANTINIKSALTVQNFDKKSIQDIFDQTYSIFLQDHPIIKELNYTKPKLEFSTSDRNSKVLASYGFGNNTIKISDKLNSITHLCLLKDENCNIYGTLITDKTAALNKKAEQDKKGLKCDIIQLSDSERKLLIAAIFAHELRHSLQDHIVTSTKDTSDIYIQYTNIKTRAIKNAEQEVFEAAKKLRDMYKQITTQEELDSLNTEFKTMEELKKYLESPLPTISEFNYYLNYTPKKRFCDDALLKFSLNKDDKRYWSTKHHLLQGALNNSSGRDDDLAYISLPGEIDAYNYEAEFLIHENVKTNARREVVYQLRESCLEKSKKGLENLEKNGYTKMVEK